MTLRKIFLVTVAALALAAPQTAWACGRHVRPQHSGGGRGANYGGGGRVDVGIGVDIAPPDDSGPPPDDYTAPPNSDDASAPPDDPAQAQHDAKIHELNSLIDDVNFLRQMRAGFATGQFVLTSDADGNLYPVPVKAAIDATVAKMFLDPKTDMDDLNGAMGRIVANVKASQLASQQALDGLIQQDQQQIAALNAQLFGH